MSLLSLLSLISVLGAETDIFFFVFREDRLKFWSDPDKEVKLAKETGVTVFRMGIDWSRIMPKEPTEGIKKAVSIHKPFV